MKNNSNTLWKPQYLGVLMGDAIIQIIIQELLYHF